MWSSWSVLTVILHISKELQSSARAWSHSVWTLSWLCPHMAWQLLLILFSWASLWRLPLLSLQEAHTLFQYFLWAVWMVTLYPSIRHSPQKLCPYQSQPCPPWTSLSQMRPDHWYSSKFLPQYHHEDQWWPWLDWNGVGRFLPLLLVKAGPSFQYQFGCVLIALCGAVFTPSLNLLGVNVCPLVMMIGEWAARKAFPVFLCGNSKELTKWAPHMGVLIKGISGKGGIGNGGVPGGKIGLLERPGADKPSDSNAVVVAGMSSSCCVLVASTPHI